MHCTVPRGAEVGLDEIGFNQENLTNRRQSSTLRSHRLVYFVAKVLVLTGSYEVMSMYTYYIICMSHKYPPLYYLFD
jgi:hypothetical protein